MLRIAYLINQYPKVSHSFIRREIQALERQGAQVLRFALRGWDADVADAEDALERDRTRYVLREGPAPLLAAAAGTLLARPARFARAFAAALRMSRGSERPLVYHLAYLAEACRFRAWANEHGATHVHAHFGTNAAEVAMLAHVLGGPAYSFTVHGPEEFDRPKALHLDALIRRAAFVVAVSSFGRAQLMRWAAPADWRKIKVVRCGVDTAFHADIPAPLPGGPRLVCVGRLCEQKGQLLLVEAVARLAARGIACELVLAGDGEMRAEVEAAIARHRLGDRVRITGWIDGEAVREEILAARVLVLPSFAEGLPVVIMEALALRRPVVTTFVAGIPELVRDGETGWLVPAGDVAALDAALAEALACPDEVLRRMGETGRSRVLERHSVDRESGRLLQHFEAASAGVAVDRALDRVAA